MSWRPPVPPTVLDAARALGLLAADGTVDADWFRDPLTRVRSVLADPSQRAALLGLLDALAPASHTVDGADWHPVAELFYLTVARSADGVTVGVGVETHGAAAQVRAHFELGRITASGASPLGAPLSVELSVPLGWSRPQRPLVLAGVRARARLGSGEQRLTVVLEGLDLDGAGPRDRVIDSAEALGGEAELLLGLLAEELRGAADAAVHLPPLLGFGDGVPPLPLRSVLANDGTAWRRWLEALVSGTSPPVLRWLERLAALAGSSAVANGNGTPNDPWRARVADFGGGAGLDATIAVEEPATGSRRLLVGVSLALAPGGTPAGVTMAIDATLAAVPLAGLSPALPLPAARVAVRGDFGNSSPVRALEGGVAWVSPPGRLTPFLVLEDVTIAGTPYDRLDLTDAGSLTAAAAGVLVPKLTALVGPRLGALVGLMPPASDPAWPHVVDPVALISRPFQAIAAVHRAALTDPVHDWRHLFAEVVALVLPAASAPAGSGTPDDPWQLPLGEAGVLALSLGAWREGDGELRLGLLLGTNPARWEVRGRLALVAIDLPANGSTAPRLNLLGGLRLEALLRPPSVAAADVIAGIVADGDSSAAGAAPLAVGVTASAAGVSLEWTPGAAARAGAFVRDLQIAVGTGAATTTVPSLEFPFAGPASATTLGVSEHELSRLVVALAARAAHVWGGPTASALAGLIGVSVPPIAAPDTALPTLADVVDSILADPGAAVRAWIARVSASATPLLPVALAALANERRLPGSGVRDDPWQLSLGSPLEILTWLSPGGAPGRLAAARERMATAPDFQALIAEAAEMAVFVPALRAAMAERSPGDVAGALIELARHFAGGDGVVPIASQTAAGFETGALVTAAHPRVPAAPEVITRIAAQIDTWAAAGPRVVLLLSAPFAGRDSWQPFLDHVGAGQTAGDATHFDLRRSGDGALGAVSTAAEHYTADLGFSNSGAGAASEIERVLARLDELVPGVPVTLVAHSASGVAALAAAVARPARVRGLITLAAPLGGAPLAPLRERRLADGLRFLQRLGPDTLGAGRLATAARLLFEALDGWRFGAEGEPPEPVAFPLTAFEGTSGDAGGVPALAVQARLGEDLFPVLRQALLALADAATSDSEAAVPTHLEIGVRLTLALDGDVDLRLRADVARVALVAAESLAPAASPDWRIEARAVLRGPAGWLTGTPGATIATADARARWAEIGVEITPETVVPIARLHDAGWRAPLVPRVELPGPAVRELLGATVVSPADAAMGPRRRLLEVLEALGLAARDPGGRLALSADGLDALGADPGGFLGARLGAALGGDRLWRALGAPEAAGGMLAVGPVEIGVEPATGASGPPWRLVARTAASSGLPLGQGAALHATARLGRSGAELEADLVVSSLRLRWSTAAGRLTVAVDEWLDPLELWPATPGAVAAAAASIAPRLLLSAALSALIDRELPSGMPLGPIDRALAAPGRSLASPNVLGSGGGGDATGGIDGTRLGLVLEIIAGLADLPPGPEPGLHLPGGLLLSVGGGPGLTEVTLATTRPVAGAVELAARARLDDSRNVTVGGRLSVTVPLPGEWPSLGIVLIADGDGFSLELHPEGVTTPIRLWPFGGLGSLLGVAERLLPAALDALLEELVPPNTPPTGTIAAVLAVAQALECWDEDGGFAAHSDALAALADDGLDAVTAEQRTALAATSVAFLARPELALPGTFSVGPEDPLVRWSFALPAGIGGGSATLEIDLTDLGLSFGVAGLAPASGALVAALSARAAAAGVGEVSAEVGLPLEGLPTPLVRLRGDAGGVAVQLLPLGAGTETALLVTLAPELDAAIGSTGLRDLAVGWALPLVARLLLEEAQPHLGTTLWAGGPTLGQLLSGAGIVSSPTGPLASPLPRLEAIARGLAAALGSTPAPLSPTLGVRFLSEGDRAGLRLAGHHHLDIGGLRATLLFGQPSTFIADDNRGLGLLLFADTPDGPKLRPEVRLVGCGLGLAGASGTPLVDAGPVHIGGARGYLFAKLAFEGGLAIDDLHAGVELDGVGLPVSHAAAGGSNPVVAGLLAGSAGSGNGSAGDAQHAAPTVNIALWERGQGLRVTVEGTSGPVWIPVQRAFGPIFIDQVGVAPAPAVAGLDVIVDGSVQLGGLLLQLDDLSLSIPFAALARPGEWDVDLAGIGVSFAAAGATASGALRRSTGSPTAYDGFLLAQVAGRSFTAVGSFSQPSDAAGSFPSLFAFAAVSVPLGGPPILYVTGLGGGAGYNRTIEPPARVTDVEDFILVEAIDDTNLAADPARALARMATSVPARRGAAFFAAGVRFTSYGFVRSTAVAVVDLDRGVDVDVLGISRMQLPPKGSPLANVELALHARFSSSERLLSVIAELTDASWVLDRNCQLTGGFAFCIWFDDGDFVLTLGGYHPDFAKPARYPDVPRLGFNWRVSSRIVVKGEAYFALTSSCVMAGGRLEATYEKGSLRAWFTTYANILVAWDPFRYDFEIGISIGASYRVRACFIKCVSFTLSFSVGADLRLRGPALHGTVSVNLGVASVSFDFGSESQRPNYLPGWNEFAAKYLSGAAPVGMGIAQGLLPAPAPGPPPTGAPEQPWRVTGELVLVTESRMPADGFRVSGGAAVAVAGAAMLDLAPLGPDATAIPSVHALGLERRSGANWIDVPLGGALLPVTPVVGNVPEAVFRFREEDDDTPAARTMPALVGLRLEGRAEPHGARPPVALVNLVTSNLRSRPLPLAAPAPDRRTELDQLGVTAELLSARAASASTRLLGAAARRLLSDDPIAVAARVSAGLPARGPSGVALAGLARRSAPPMVTPLAAGLARHPLGLGAPPPRPIAPATPPVLVAPRLRAVLTTVPGATRDAAPWTATRVSPRLASGAPRLAPPAAPATAVLERVPATSAPRPTRAAITGRSWQTGEIGAAAAPHERAQARDIEARVGDAGVTIPAGVTQVWDLPASAREVVARGPGALRLNFLATGGTVISDIELTPAADEHIAVPPGSVRMAATCLGISPVSVRAAAPGAVTGRVAPPGGVVATGWELSDRVLVVAPTMVLTRGACLLLASRASRASTAQRRPSPSGPHMAALGDLVSGPAAVETRLPPGTSLVLVMLDELDATSAAAGDLRISATGARLVGPALRVASGRRRALLYEVTEPAAPPAPLIVGVASVRGFAAAGVVGLGGRVADWAARFRAGIPDGLVPDEPLTPHGEVTLRLSTGDFR